MIRIRAVPQHTVFHGQRHLESGRGDHVVHAAGPVIDGAVDIHHEFEQIHFFGLFRAVGHPAEQRAIAFVLSVQFDIDGSGFELRRENHFALPGSSGLRRADGDGRNALPFYDCLQTERRAQLWAAAIGHKAGKVGLACVCLCTRFERKLTDIREDFDLRGQPGISYSNAVLEHFERTALHLDRGERRPDDVLHSELVLLPDKFAFVERLGISLSNDTLVFIKQQQRNLVVAFFQGRKIVQKEGGKFSVEPRDLCHQLIFVFVGAHHDQLGLGRAAGIFARAVNAFIHDRGKSVGVRRVLVFEIEILFRRPHLDERVELLFTPFVVGRAGIDGMEFREPILEQHLARPSCSADIEPEIVFLFGNAGELALETKLEGLPGHELDEAVFGLVVRVGRVNQAFSALDKKSEPHSFRSCVVILQGDFDVEDVLHQGPHLLHLKTDSLRIKDKPGLGRVPDMLVEEHDIHPGAADAVLEPQAIGRAIGRRQLDDIPSVFELAGVAFAAHLLEWDFHFSNPERLFHAGTHEGLGLPTLALAGIQRPMLIGNHADRVDEPFEHPPSIALTELTERSQLKLHMVILFEPVERMAVNIGEASAGLEPGIFRISRNDIGEKEVFLVVTGEYPRLDLMRCLVLVSGIPNLPHIR